MQIIKLTLKNLNSLVGTWQIDFTNPSFKDAGIFAITGQTGAGKTTILDAICLALYGETPRINNISNNSNDIMSRRTADCLAEVVIVINDAYYRCSWSQKRAYNKPDGNLQTAQHSISLLPHAHAKKGDILEDSIRKTKDKIHHLLGMDFRQFTRSIMLAQGSFSAFLQASSDERAKILEQITGTDIYADISMRVHKKKQEHQQQLEKLKATLGGIQLLSDAQFTELNTMLTELHTQQSNTKTQVNVISQRHQWLKNKAKLHQQLTEQQQQLTVKQTQLKDFAKHGERLQQAQRAFAIEGTFYHLQQLIDDHKEQQHRLTTLTHKLPDKQQALADIKQQVDTHNEHLQSLEKALTQQQPLFKQIRMLDQHIEQCQQRLAEEHAQYKKLSDSMAQEQQNSQHTKQTLAQLTIDIAQLQNELSGYNHQDLHHARQQLLEQGRALSDTLQQRQKLAEEQHNIYQQYQHLGKQSELLVNQRQQLQNQQQHDQKYLAQQQKQAQQLLIQTQTMTGITTFAPSLDDTNDDNDANDANDDNDASGNTPPLSKAALTTTLKQIADALIQGEQSNNQRQQQLTKQQQLSQHLQTDWQQLTDNLGTLQTQQHTLNQQHHQEAQLTQKLNELDADIQDLQDTLALYDKVNRLEEYIIHLSDDEPCPLCGSTEHPYLTNLDHGSHPHYLPKQTDAQHFHRTQHRTKDKLAQLLNTQKNQQTDLTNLQKKLAVMHHQHADKRQQHLKLITQTKQHLQQLLTLCHQANNKTNNNALLITQMTDNPEPSLHQHITQLQSQLQKQHQAIQINIDQINISQADTSRDNPIDDPADDPIDNHGGFVFNDDVFNDDMNDGVQCIHKITNSLQTAEQHNQTQLDKIHTLSNTQRQLAENIERHFANQVAHEQQQQQLNHHIQHTQTKLCHLQDMDKRVRQDTQDFIKQARTQCQQLMALINLINIPTPTTPKPTSLLASVPTSLTQLAEQLEQLEQMGITNSDNQPTQNTWTPFCSQPYWQQLQSEDILQPLRDIAIQWKQLIETHAKKTQQLHEHSNQQHSLTATLTAQQTRQQAYQQEQQTLSQTISTQHAQLQLKQQERHDKFAHRNPDETEAQLQADITAQRQKLEASKHQQQQQQLAIQNLQSQLAELSQSMDKKSQQIDARQQDFIKQLKKQGFIDMNDFVQARLPTDEREQLQAQQNRLDTSITHLQNNLDDLHSQLDELKKQVEQQDKHNIKTLEMTLEMNTIDDSDAFLKTYQQLTGTALTNAIDAMNHKKNHLKQQLEEQQRQLGGIEQQLKTHHDNLSKTQAQHALISQQQQENQLWDKLHALIGQADGKKYRNFVQGLTFDIMIHEANHQLKKMNDRYLLYRDDNISNSLELSVIDLYQGAEVRTSKNLSGGESFIISLALALGLSAMASHNMPMNSLFLDEGFGTLDEDSLEIALDTLTHLHQEGKLIGVISHIQSLKDRILTQIQVSKLSGGVSKLSGAGVQRLG